MTFNDSIYENRKNESDGIADNEMNDSPFHINLIIIKNNHQICAMGACCNDPNP